MGKDIGRLAAQVNRATVSAINSTAQAIKQAELTEMRSVFDRPTPYTMNALRIAPARTDRLSAEVGFKTDIVSTGKGTTGEWHYLQPQVFGGGRRIKGLEYNLRAAGVLPAGWNVTPGAFARLDAYGNLNRGQITQILSQLRITLRAGSTRNLPIVSGNERRVIGALRRAGGRYFAIPPGRKGIKPGVYLRELIGSKAPMPVLKFVRASRYSQRFDFDRVAKGIAAQRLQADFDDALRAATQSA